MTAATTHRRARPPKSPPARAAGNPAPPAGDAAAGRRRARSPGGFFVRVLAISAILPVAVCAGGLPYYLLSLEERPWSRLHEWYRPSGYVGQSLGFLALGLFLFLWLFPIRKRVSALAFTGSVARWLDVHIVAGLLVPFVAATHAAWRFHGLIGLGYLAMFVVSISGVVGRYLYAHIPRRRNGLELDREEAAAERRALIGRLVENTGIPLDRVVDLLSISGPAERRLGTLATLRALMRDDVARRRAVRKLLAEWKRALPRGEKPDRRTLRAMRHAARREMALQQQIRLLDATQRIFRLWHVAHLPFAIVAFLAVALHVAVAIAFGATWLT